MLCKFRQNQSINKKLCPQKGSVHFRSSFLTNATGFTKFSHILGYSIPRKSFVWFFLLFFLNPKWPDMGVSWASCIIFFSVSQAQRGLSLILHHHFLIIGTLNYSFSTMYCFPFTNCFSAHSCIDLFFVCSSWNFFLSISFSFIPSLWIVLDLTIFSLAPHTFTWLFWFFSVSLLIVQLKSGVSGSKASSTFPIIRS